MSKGIVSGDGVIEGPEVIRLKASSARRVQKQADENVKRSGLGFVVADDSCTKCNKRFSSPGALVHHMESPSTTCKVRETQSYGHVLRRRPLRDWRSTAAAPKAN